MHFSGEYLCISFGVFLCTLFYHLQQKSKHVKSASTECNRSDFRRLVLVQQAEIYAADNPRFTASAASNCAMRNFRRAASPPEEDKSPLGRGVPPPSGGVVKGKIKADFESEIVNR